MEKMEYDSDHDIEVDNVPSFNQDRGVEIIGKVLPAHRCVVCKDILVNAMQTHCGCRACERCLLNILSQSDPAECPNNGLDCGRISRYDPRWQILPDNGTRKEIGLLTVKCPNSLCLQTCSWKKLDAHLENCQYTEVTCALCEKNIYRKDCDKHKEHECEGRQTRCSFCQLSMRRDVYEKIHINILHEESCGQFEAACPYCRKGKYNKTTIRTHSKECSKWKHPCDLARFGCTFEGARLERESHTSTEVAGHLQLVMQHSLETETIVANVREEMKSLHEQVAHLATVAQKATERAKQCEMRLASCLENMYKMEQSQSGSTSTTRPLSALLSQSNISSVQDLSRQVTELKSNIGNMSVNNEGVYIWKIDNYRARRERARRGEETFFDSPPFLASRFGYRMRMRVYLYGDGVGRSSHVSLFFIIMRGEYDALLKWPFNENVKIYVLDQLHGFEPIVEVLRPSGDTTAYQRPTTEHNVAMGSPRFISHRLLESSPLYLKADTFFVQVEVDKTNRPS